MCPMAARVMGDAEPVADKVRRVTESATTGVGGDAKMVVWAGVGRGRGWPVAAESLQVSSGAGGCGA
jgi:hypothetical protein